MRCTALREPIEGRQALDLCCGEGHLVRTLADRGADVDGVDVSRVNLAEAEWRSAGHAERQIRARRCRHAQSLSHLGDGRWGPVVCQMALMDLPEIDASFGVVHPQRRRLRALCVEALGFFNGRLKSTDMP
jgi:2-polyprenyl-3-methyl-5-hydroxy-6-metoxy-1,4-benzoquinol methylase